MHEVGVMQNALDLALEQAVSQGASRIERLALRIGPLSGVVPEALEFAFSVVTLGTLAEGGELLIEHMPIRAHCRACNLDFEPELLNLECPRCRHFDTTLIGGRELELAYLEIS